MSTEPERAAYLQGALDATGGVVRLLLEMLAGGCGPGPAASPAKLPPTPPPMTTGSVSASATNPATLATPARPGP